jgi:hypothetical protein
MVMMGSCWYGSSISRDILEFLYRITIKEILELVNNCLIETHNIIILLRTGGKMHLPGLGFVKIGILLAENLL